MLKTIKQEHLSSDPVKAKVMQERIDYAIEKIGQRNIFDVDIIDQLDLATTKKQGKVTSGWLREFSSIHMDEVRQSYLANVLAQKKQPSTPSEASAFSTTPSLATVIQNINQFAEELKDIDKVEFNIHRCMDKVGRKPGLSTIGIDILQ